MKNLIMIGFLIICMYSCSEPSYDYDASNIISYLRGYKEEVPLPDLIIHRDSSFSIREDCYRLMKDKKMYVNNRGVLEPLSKDEIKKIFEEIRQEYLKQKSMDSVKNRPHYNPKKHYPRDRYFG